MGGRFLELLRGVRSTTSFELSPTKGVWPPVPGARSLQIIFDAALKNIEQILKYVL